VDIICVAWTAKENDSKLWHAIEDALRGNILVFCAAPDEDLTSPSNVFRIRSLDAASFDCTGRYKEADALYYPATLSKLSSPEHQEDAGSWQGNAIATALAAGVVAKYQR